MGLKDGIDEVANPSRKRGANVEEIDRAQSKRQGEPSGIVVEMPPARVGRQFLRSWAKPHVRDAKQGQFDVVAQWMGMDAVVGELRETCVQWGVDGLGLIVVGDELESLLALLRRIEGAIGQRIGIDVVAGNDPIGVFGRGKVGDPCLDPAIESHGDEFSGLIGVARGERLELMHRSQVAKCPWNERGEGDERKNCARLRELCRG